jgi:hypothetical protein
MSPNFQHPVQDVHTIANQGEWKVWKLFKVRRNVTKTAVSVARRFQREESLRDWVRPVSTIFAFLRRWRKDGLTVIWPNGLPI